MATVEQRDTQPSGLGVLSNTLDIFNDFKDDKDSDEESFHLPMLDCDDDLDSNNKETVTNGEKELQCQNAETEDEILNKFDIAVTPDIDPKIEDKLLDDPDELCEKKPEEQNLETDASDKPSCEDLQNVDEDKSVTVKEEPATENKELESEKQENEEASCSNLPEVTESLDEAKKDNTEQKEDTQQQEAEVKKEVEDEKVIGEEEKDQVSENRSEEDAKLPDPVMDETNENDGSKDSVESKESIPEVDEEVDMKETAEASAVDMDKDLPVEEEIEKNEASQEVVGEPQQPVEGTQELQEPLIKNEEMKMEVEESGIEVSNSTDISPNEVQNNSENEANTAESKTDADECMDVEVAESDEKEDVKSDKIVESSDNKEDDGKENSNNEVTGNDSQCEKVVQDKSEESGTKLDQHEFNKPEEPPNLDESAQQKSVDSKPDSAAPDRCENSNDSNKNLDCDDQGDDLLDISIIRDADEDNASAIAENANDNHSSEKSDNDDQDEGSEKAENELDESEMDQEENSLAMDKDDRMDFDDGNSSNLAYQDNTVSGSTSDSEAKDDADTRDSENESSNSNGVLKEKTNKIADVVDSEKNQTEQLTEMRDVDTQSVDVDDQDSLKENSVKLGGKRSLSEIDTDNDATNKKIKLSETTVATEKRKSKKVKTLITFEKFMQNKKFGEKLTRSDLEQFCLQKICEAIVHKTDVGELHQTIKKQEQIIENLRKDLQQLTKQTRDLDIVNKKLMSELRTQNGIKKPLVPLKITRSVGLQVKLNIGVDNNSRRKTTVAVSPRTPTATNTPRQRTVTPVNAGVVRQVASPRKTPTSTPLLSQALQNNRQISPANANKRTPARPKPAEPQKPANPGVIDLTDEDDRASKTAAGTPVKIVNKTIPLSQAKTLNIVQNKPVAAKPVNNSQNKTVAIGQVKNTTVGGKVGTGARTVTTLPQGVRLTPTQVKNGSITIPASVVTSNSGTTQLMYVVQPTSSLGQVVTSTAGGAQKAVLLNFQSTNGVLTSALNGSAVSVIPTKTTNTMQLKTVAAPRKHPAPLPTPPPIAVSASLKPLLPKPHLSIRKTDTGIILQWRMPYNLDIYEGIASYQLFAYQETNAAPSTDMWRKVGDVKALALPMACTLTQFADKNKYYFAVRSVDVHKRIGAFSDPEEISL